MHMTPEELRSRLQAVKGMQAGSPQRIHAHRELAEQCPAFVPNLLSLSRSLLLDRQDTGAQARFTEGERALRGAVEVSGEDASALIELAHFLDVVRDSPGEAEPLFAEAARRAGRLLEEAWAGWIGALGQQEKLDAALELSSRAQRVFPDSELIAEATALVRQSTAR
jgi:hypothetical protein